MRWRFNVIVHPDENTDVSQKVVSRGVLSVIDNSHTDHSPRVYFCETEGEAVALRDVLAGKNPGKFVSYNEVKNAVASQPGPTKAFKISSSGVLPG